MTDQMFQLRWSNQIWEKDVILRIIVVDGKQGISLFQHMYKLCLVSQKELGLSWTLYYQWY